MISMKYLKTVILENFQSHKHTSIEFNEGLNVILGPSDSGKSAIIRGIKWALYNEPAGDFFIKEGEREASVTLIFSDDTKVQRIRSKSKNIYILSKQDGEELRFEGFGMTVPEEIIEATGIYKIKLDSDYSNAINLAEQLEGPFLLSEKTSTRAVAIGRLIGVNVIDDALRETLRDKGNKSRRKNDLEDRKDKLKEELGQYEYLDMLKLKLDRVENLRTIIAEKSKMKERLESSAENYRRLNKDLVSINKQLSRLDKLDEIDKLLKDLNYLASRLRYLEIKRENYNNYRRDIYSSADLISKLNGVDHVDRILKKTDKLYSQINRLTRLKNKFDTIKGDRQALNRTYTRLENLDRVEDNLSSLNKISPQLNKLKKLKDEYDKVLESLKVGSEFIYRFKDLEKAESLSKEMDTRVKRLNSLMDLSMRLKKLEINLKNESQEIERLDKGIEIQLSKYKEILGKFEKCPFCLNEIDSDKMEHIIKHYK